MGRRIILAAGALGIGLILLSEFRPSGSVKTAANTSAEAFVQKTEQRLSEIVCSIEGAGECRIMLTLENGVEYVYATEQKVNTNEVEDTDSNSSKLSQQNNSEESVIIVDTDEGRKGLLVTEIEPTVKGVVVVCGGGDQPLVQERVIHAVTTALNISAKRVCVTKLS